MEPVIPSRVSDQLNLPLFEGVPWEGQSPRALTRARKALFLRPEPPRHEVFFDPEQLELWPVHRGHKDRRAPLILRGASLLLEPK